MPTESKKLQTYGNAITAATARIAHELMDPARKKPETPLEREQREVIRGLVKALNSANDLGLVSYAPLHLALAAAAPYLRED